eukprot:jgi/Mesvir1/16294/Mv14225-RA.3
MDLPGNQSVKPANSGTWTLNNVASLVSPPFLKTRAADDVDRLRGTANSLPCLLLNRACNVTTSNPRSEAAVERAISVDNICRSDLTRLSTAFCECLVAASVLPGEVVTICMPNVAEFAPAFLGTAFARAIAAPLDPACPPREFEFSISASGSRVLVLVAGDVRTQELQGIAQRMGMSVCCVKLEIEPQAMGGKEACHLHTSWLSRAEPWPHAENNALSSGMHPIERLCSEDDVVLLLQMPSMANGEPMLERVTHGQLVRHAVRLAELYDLTRHDTTMLLMPFSHAGGLVATFLASFVAGCPVLVPRLADAPSLFSLIARHRISWYAAAPALHHMLLEQAEAHPEQLWPAGQLRFVCSLGGSLDAAQMARMNALLRARVVTLPSQCAGLLQLPEASTQVAVPVDAAGNERPHPPHAHVAGNPAARVSSACRGLDTHSSGRTTLTEEAAANVEKDPLGCPAEELGGQQGSSTSKVDVSLVLTGDPGSADQLLLLEYRTDLWCEASMQRLGQQLVCLASSAVASPETPVGRLPMMTEAERRRVVEEWNATDTAFACAGKCLHELFDEQVSSTPDHVAVETGTERVTYRELQQRADALACCLRDAGMVVGGRVGLCLKGCAEMVVGMLAILKAGCAYVPLDPEYPAERAQGMLEDADVSILLTRPYQPPTWGADTFGHLKQLEVPLTPAYAPDLPAQKRVIHRKVFPTDLAYVLFTSGTTGRPKGVMVEHRNVCNLVACVIDRWQLDGSSRVLQLANPSFDASVAEVFGTLAAGGTLVVHPPGSDLQDSLRHATCAFVVPSVLSVFNPAHFPGLSTICIGGEMVPLHMATSWAAGRRCLNGYGPTECCVFATMGQMIAEDQSVSIGGPLPNVRAYVLDAYLQPTPIGVPGELYIGGAGVARGYANRDDLTKEKFLDNPFAAGRLYRTGDLARWLPDGRLQCLGRVDRQVKLSGVRIELGEVEGVLEACPGVAKAVAILQDVGRSTDNPGLSRKHLVAYVCPANVQVDALMEAAQRKLPSYMVPSAVVALERFPVTISGKVDSRALPPVDLSTSGGREYVAPRNVYEARVQAVCQDVLGVASLSVLASFHKFGINSLMAMALVHQMRERLAEFPGAGEGLRVTTVLSHPSVAELAAAMTCGRQVTRAHAVEPPLQPFHGDMPTGILPPVSYGQEQMLALHELDPTSPAYNMGLWWSVVGHVDVDILRQSMQVVVGRHEALRTHYAMPAIQAAFQGAPGAVQVVVPPGDFVLPFEVVDAGDGDQGLWAALHKEASTPFDPYTGPLVRCLLVKRGDRSSALMVNMHHSVSDGLSGVLLMRELCHSYSSILKGGELCLPPLPVQYSDYALWQRRWLEESGEMAAQLEYWKVQLADTPQLLELPTDKPRPRVQSFKGYRLEFTLERRVVQVLKKLARDCGATFFMVMLTLWAALLGRWSRQDKVVVGTPWNGRNKSEVQHLIGYFINPLALCVDVDGTLPFSLMVQHVRDVVLGAMEHAEAPFHKVVEAVGATGSVSGNPIFQSMIMPNEMVGMTELALGPDARIIPGRHIKRHGSSKVDVSLALCGESQTGNLTLLLEYRTDLWCEASMQRLGQQLVCLASSAVASPETPVGRLPMMTEAERRRVVEEWNATDTAFACAGRCLHELFDEQVSRTPDHVAVETGTERVTYRELQQRADALACCLRDAGVVVGGRVGLCLKGCAEMVVGMLAILKAGCAYVPLDPEYPAERAQGMLEDADVSILLTRPYQPPTWGADTFGHLKQLEVPLTPAYAPDLPAQKRVIHRKVFPTDLAYVLFTSGTTGRPKGVMVEHRNVCNLVACVIDRCQLDGSSRVLQLTSPSFDVSVAEVFGTLAAGGTLVVHPPGSDLQDSLRHATCAFVVPSVLSVFNPAHFPGLSTICIGGEMVPLHMATSWAAGRRCLNGYGPTECCVFATMGQMIAEDQSVSIGGPLPNVRAYVLDAYLQPTPIGVPGELYIGGAGVARGYANRDDLTKEKFLDNPFAAGRLYRTGDLARWLPDGRLQCLGRLDRQVKLSGVRIELGEVEGVLEACPGVAKAVAILQDVGRSTDNPGLSRKHLVAYVCPANVQVDALMEAAQRKLPSYMVPSAVVALERFPVTISGKVDSRALPPVDLSTSGGREYVAPRNVYEARVQAVCQDVLGVASLSVLASFHKFGINSLMAMALVHQMRERLAEFPGAGEGLRVTTVLSHPSVAELAAAMTCGRQVTRAHAVEPPLQPFHGDMPTGILPPVSYGQEQMLALHELDPTSPAYNMGLWWSVVGHVDVDILRQSMQVVVGRHEALRTHYAMPAMQAAFQGAPGAVQVVVPPGDFVLPFEVVDAGDGDQGLWAALHKEASTPFDPYTGPLVRCLLVKRGDRSSALMVNMHHSVSDGLSGVLLMRELCHSYSSILKGGELCLPLLPVQYSDYALWQRRWLEESGEMAAQLEYWKVQLADAPRLLELPTDKPRPRVQSFKGDRLEFTLERRVVQVLKKLARDCGATFFMVMLTLWAALLGRWSRQDKVVVGTPWNGRNKSEVQHLIGYFINPLALCVDVDGTLPFSLMVQHVRDVVLGAMEHAEAPFHKVVEAVGATGSVSGNPIFQSMIMPNEMVGMTELALGPDARIIPGRHIKRHGSSKVDVSLALCGESQTGNLTLLLEYRTDLWCESSMQRLGQQLVCLASSAVASPETPVGRLPMMTEAERMQLIESSQLKQWLQAPPSPLTLCDLWDCQVATRPADMAARCQEVALSFSQLDGAAGLLSAALAASGVGAEMRVAIVMERSLLILAAMLGVLKAGACYVSLDPANPPAYLASLLDAASITAILWDRAVCGRLQGMAGLEQTTCFVVDDLVADASTASGTGGGRGLNQDFSVGPFIHADQAAICLFSSGSSGVPKGVELTHRALVAKLEGYWAACPFAPGEACLARTTVSFVDHTLEILGSLLHGVPVVLATAQEARDPASLLHVVASAHVTRLVVVPSLLQAMLADTQEDERVRATWREGPLSLVISSGEPLPLSLAQAFLAAAGDHCQLVNLYGSTETCGDATWAPVTRAMVAAGHVTVGHPLLRAVTLVLDDHGQLAPPGVPGELCVGGGVVARGYLHQPELTASRFTRIPIGDLLGGDAAALPASRFPQHPVSDMFTPSPDEAASGKDDRPSLVLYRTGDCARLLPCGDLALMGRLDHQVKVRGVRLELGFVEQAMARLPGVAAAGAVLVPATQQGLADAAGHDTLVAVVSPRRLLPEALLAALGQQLPQYALPARILCEDELPRLISGKLDRRKLLAMAAAEMAEMRRVGTGGGGREAPTSHAAVRMDPLEAKLAALWGKVLRLPSVSVFDDFFNIGGNSLVAVQLQRELAREMVRDPALAPLASGDRHLSVFSHRTISSMAAEAASALGRTAGRGASGTSDNGHAFRGAAAASSLMFRPQSLFALLLGPASSSSGAEPATSGEEHALSGVLEVVTSNLRFLWSFSVVMLHFGHCGGQNLRCFQNTQLAGLWAPHDNTSLANFVPRAFQGGVLGLSILSGMGAASGGMRPSLRTPVLAVILALLMEFGVSRAFDDLVRSSPQEHFSTTAHLWGLWALAFNQLLLWLCVGLWRSHTRREGPSYRNGGVVLLLLAAGTVQFLLPILFALLWPPASAAGVRGMWFGPWGMHQLGWEPLGPRVLTSALPFAIGYAYNSQITRLVHTVRSHVWLRVALAAIFVQLTVRSTFFLDILSGLDLRSSEAARFATVADVMATWELGLWWREWPLRVLGYMGALAEDMVMAFAMLAIMPALDGTVTRFGRASLPIYLFHPHVLRLMEPFSFWLLRQVSSNMPLTVMLEVLLPLSSTVCLCLAFAAMQRRALGVGKTVLGLSMVLHVLKRALV